MLLEQHSGVFARTNSVSVFRRQVLVWLGCDFGQVDLGQRATIAQLLFYVLFSGEKIDSCVSRAVSDHYASSQYD